MRRLSLLPLRHGAAVVAIAVALAAGSARADPFRSCAAHWHGAWSASPLEVAGDDPIKPADLADTTLRQTIRLTGGGTHLRLRLTNLEGRAPLRLDHVRVALADATGSARIDAATSRTVRFAGRDAVEIPAGADYLSDPIDRPAAAGAVLSISLHLPAAPDAITSHPGSRTTIQLAAGEQTDHADLARPRAMVRWYFLSGVEAEGCGSAIVALGDSITDGHGATTDGDDRWTDRLAARLRAGGRGDLTVLNAGIGGNRLLLDGLGPNALARFDRDVLAQSKVRYLIVLEGINDLGTLTRDQPVAPADHAALVDRLIAAYAQIVARAHAQGLVAIGGTVLPDGGSPYYHPDADNEADRQALNRWIRGAGHFDGVIDFDAALRDPAHPDRLLPAYDSGDHLHPGPAGYARMAAAVPLALFR